MGSAVGTEPWIFNPLEIWSHQLSIWCRLLAQTSCFPVQQSNLGNSGTRMKQYTSVLLLPFSEMAQSWFFFFSSKASLFSYVLLLKILIFGSYWKSQWEPLLSSWLIWPCLCLVLLRCILDIGLAFSNVLKVETIWLLQCFMANIWCWCSEVFIRCFWTSDFTTVASTLWRQLPVLSLDFYEIPWPSWWNILWWFSALSLLRILGIQQLLVCLKGLPFKRQMQNLVCCSTEGFTVVLSSRNITASSVCLLTSLTKSGAWLWASVIDGAETYI